MEKVDSTQSLMNMIMPRMETKKVNTVQESFKDVFERGSRNNTTDSTKKSIPREEKKYFSDTNEANRDKNMKDSSTSTKVDQSVQDPKNQTKTDNKESLKEQQPTTQADTKTTSTETNQTNEQTKEVAKAGSPMSEDKEMIEDDQMISLMSLEGLHLIIKQMLDMLKNGSEGKQLQLPAEGLTDKQLVNLLENNPELLKMLKESVGKTTTPEGTIAISKDLLEKFNEALKVAGYDKTVKVDIKPEIPQEAKVEKVISPTSEQLVNKQEVGFLPQQNIVKAEENFATLSKSLEELLEQDQSQEGEENTFNLNQIKVTGLNNVTANVKTIGTERGNFQLSARVMEEVKISLNQNKSEMQIKLEPETLGKLTIKISSENGVLNASFFAENDKAKMMIENQMMELKKTLESQGIQVQNLSVTVDSGQEERNRHKNIMEAQKYSKIKGINHGLEELRDFEEMRNPYLLEDEFTEII